MPRPLPRTDTGSLDVSLSTFGVFVQVNFDVGGGDVALLFLAPPDPRPAVALVFLDDAQDLALCYRYGSFVFTWAEKMRVTANPIIRGTNVGGGKNYRQRGIRLYRFLWW